MLRGIIKRNNIELIGNFGRSLDQIHMPKRNRVKAAGKQ